MVNRKVVKGYQDLIVWQKSKDLAKQIYRTTSKFPSSETYGLTSQFRRAVISISANLAEGYGRKSRPEFAQFVTIATGSATELECLIILAEELGFIKPVEAEHLKKSIVEILRMLQKLRQTLRTKKADV